MELTIKPLRRVPDRKAIRQLYHTAFPKEEQMPWGLVRLLSLRRGISVDGYYHGDCLCGFTFSASTDDTLFILFLAVPDGLRGQGWGSALLQQLKNTYPNHTIVLNVEPLDSAAENYAQRLERMRFYEKNGFFDTQYDIDEVGGTFRVLSTRPELDVAAYLRVFRKLSYGFWKPYIRRGEDYDPGTDA